MSWHTFSEFAIPHIPQRIESRRSICAPFTKGVIRAGRQIIEDGGTLPQNEEPEI